LGTGVNLCLIYAGSLVHRWAGSRAAIRSLELSTLVETTPKERREIADARSLVVDRTLWSTKRNAAYFDSPTVRHSPPLAVMRIPRIGLEVPVFEGTDELVLNPPSLSLVTCYPFYSIGHAPRRYIVRCTQNEGSGTRTFSSGPASQLLELKPAG
jgi:sortase (surface protein transpeptidase)